MSLFKRKDTWWCDFTMHGDRYRESLKTTDKREAIAKEKERIAEVQAGKNLAVHRHFARWPFSQAADFYIEDLKLRLAQSSVRSEKERSKPLRDFFKETPVSRITAEMVSQFQTKRKSEGLSGRTINMEVGALRRILKKAKRWHAISTDVKMFPQGSDIGQAITAKQKAVLLEVAASRPEWQVARCAAVLALNTTMRGCELKALRWKDVDLFQQTLTVGRSKTEAGHRRLPLNRDAITALAEMRERSEALAAAEPEHYVFPSCEIGKFDATRPMKNWRTAWRTLTKTAGLRGLRFHDLRHTAITELSERDTSDMTIMSIAGHVSRRMLEHYSHIRLEAKRTALDALATSEKSVTAQSTSHPQKKVSADSTKLLM